MTTIDGVLTVVEHIRRACREPARYRPFIDAPHDIEPSEPRPDGFLRACVRAVLLVALFLASQVVGGMLLGAAGVSLSGSTGNLSASHALALCALEGVVLLTAVAVLLSGGRTMPPWLVGGPRAAVRALRASTPVGLLVILPGMALVAAEGDPLIAPSLTLATAGALVLFAVLVGVAEELWFRGLVLESLDPRKHPWRAVLVSSVLFGAPHVLASADGATAATLLNATAVTLAVAVPFACVRIVHGSLLPLMVWHAAVDIWAFLHTGGVTAVGSPKTAEALMTLVVPAVIALAYLAWMRPRITPVAPNPRAHVD